ncbi:MAG: glycosyltransferase family 4 protein [Clostridia bacterium]|nr:glycosyltransferase family 4 protein [Clostridia bacterium]
MRKVILCSDVDYPRGGAASNYLQYLALALQAAGYRVELMVWKNPEYLSRIESEGGWKGMPLHDLPRPESKNRIVHHLMNVQFYPHYLRKAFAKLNLHKGDVVFAYTNSVAIFQMLFGLRKKIGIRIAACPVEHFPKEHFTAKQYRIYQEYYDGCLPKTDLLFPISKAIRDYLAPSGKPMMLLPPLADVSEYAPVQKPTGKRRVIFPANGMMKDALGQMLGAIIDLPDALKANMEFHLCGVKSSVLENLLAPAERSELEKLLTVHGWMEYDQLVDLYRSMHFLFIAREISQTTLSNFPSKVPELLCHGVVPVASRVGEYTDGYLTDGENAIVFDGCDRDSCRRALIRALTLTDDEYNALSANAYWTAKTKFDYTVWAPRLWNAIESTFPKEAAE